jgi:hypothetical protein
MSTQRILRRLPLRPAALPWADWAGRDRRLWDAATRWFARSLRWCRLSLVDIAWAGFVLLNLAAMRLLPAWQTVPFLAIW